MHFLVRIIYLSGSNHFVAVFSNISQGFEAKINYSKMEVCRKHIRCRLGKIFKTDILLDNRQLILKKGWRIHGEVIFLY